MTSDEIDNLDWLEQEVHELQVNLRIQTDRIDSLVAAQEEWEDERAELKARVTDLEREAIMSKKVRAILDELASKGHSSAHLNRVLGISVEKEKDLPETVVLLNLVKEMPWLLTVAELGYTPNAVKGAVLMEAGRAILEEEL